MAERLVDVLDSRGTVIHTYPITLGQSGDEANDSACEAKALKAAAHGRLFLMQIWKQEGRPEGRADEFWHRTRDFETP
ncbi:DUF2934 domain-containing protein [Paraburkholderia sp. B3]|jgi:hypothetical protein|uniref:DUF2934 domain-containing protein n=1 Tax=Paraburkholderia sp. B3 TaxID=3134791 RepID=UPI003981D57D